MPYDRFTDVVICPNGAMSEAKWCPGDSYSREALMLRKLQLKHGLWTIEARFNGFALVYLLANLKDAGFVFLDDQDGKPLRDGMVSFWQDWPRMTNFPVEDYSETYDYLENLFLERGERPDIDFDGRKGDHIGWVRVIKIYEEYMTRGHDDLPPTHYRFIITFPRDGNEGVVSKLRILGAVNTLSNGRQ